MYKLHIALGWSVIKTQLQRSFFDEYSDLWSKIKQHKIICSDNLEKYYYEQAEKEGLLGEYRDFIASISYYGLCEPIRDNFKDISRNISNYLKNKCKYIAIVISEDSDLQISKSSCKNQYSINQAIKDKNGPLAIYSFNAVFYADRGENADKYINWYANLMRDEKEISFIDPYILRRDGTFKCLVNYYFPHIRPGCKLNLHVPYDSDYIDKAIKEAKKSNINLKIIRYQQMNHDRYIITSERILTIGLGLDFMEEDEGTVIVRTGTNFSMREKDENEEYMQEEHRLAGQLYHEPKR